LAESFRELQRWSVGQLQTLFERLIDQGYMRQPDPPEDLARIATNTFIVWSNWVRYLTSSRATDEVDHVDIVEGAIQSFLTLAPYLEPSVAEEVRGIFDLRASKRGRVVAKPRRKSGRRVR
jgi:hypothetical protein